jgi:hypothetical protein
LRDRSYIREVVASQTLRLYVAPPELALGDSAKRVVGLLERSNYALTWSQIGRDGYWAVGPAICASDGLVVFVNRAWSGSTYHAMEVSFALGEQSYRGQPELDRPRLVFAYVEDEAYEDSVQRWLRDERVLRLPGDPGTAVATVDAVLRAAYGPRPKLSDVRRLLPVGEMTPERYVALKGHKWAAASIFTYRYPDDPEVDEFCRRVGTLLRDHSRWEELRREWLTPEERWRVLEEARAMAETDF